MAGSSQVRVSAAAGRVRVIQPGVYVPPSRTYYPRRHSIVPGGGDQTDRINDLWALMRSDGPGGVAEWEPGEFVAEGQLRQPMDAASHVSASIRNRGAGGWSAGRGPLDANYLPTTGTRFTLRNTHATDPKILAAGAGNFELEDISFVHPNPTGGVSGPMLGVRWASVKMTRCALVTPQLGNDCAVNGVEFGSSVVPLSGGDPSGFLAYQGYGGLFLDNTFNGIACCAMLRSWANAIVFAFNKVWVRCGGLTPWRVIAPTGDSGVGNVFFKNTVEVPYYDWAAVVDAGTNTEFDDLVYDADASQTLGACWFKAGTVGNKCRSVFTRTNVAQVLVRDDTSPKANTSEPRDLLLAEPTRTPVPVEYSGLRAVTALTQGGGGAQRSDGLVHRNPATGGVVFWRGYADDPLMHLVWSPDGTTGAEVVLGKFSRGGDGRPILDLNNLAGTQPGIVKAGGFWSEQEYTLNSGADVTGPTGLSFTMDVEDKTNGASALVKFQGGQTPVVVAQAGPTTFVTGAPGATEIRVIGGGSGVAFRAGSGRHGAVVRTCLLAAHGA